MKKILVFVLFIFVLYKIEAQQLSYSPFTRYGIGEFIYQGSIRNLAMGKTGLADISRFHINKINPASTGLIKHNSVLFEVSFFDKLSVFRTPDDEQINNLSNIRAIYGGFPVIANWWHFSMGLVPFSAMGYKIVYSDSLYTPYAGAKYSNIYEGAGSVDEFFIGNTFSYKKKFHLGVNLSYLFGSLNRKTSTYIDESYNNFTSLYFDEKREIFRGFKYEFGFIYNDTILKNVQENSTENLLSFAIGGIYSNKQVLHTLSTEYIGRRTRFINRTKIDTFYIDTIARNRIVVPQSYGVGLSIKIYDQLLLEANYKREIWHNIEFFNQKYYDTRFIAFGMEYCRQPVSTIYWKTIRYRLGFYKQSKYIAFNNKPLIEQGYTFGMAFPLKSILFNIAFIYGNEHSDGVEINHTFAEIHFGFSIYDIWFIKRKFL